MEQSSYYVGFLPEPLEEPTIMFFPQNDCLNAPRPRRPRWRDPEKTRQREVLQQQIKLAVARAYVLSDPKAHLKPEVLWPYLQAAVPGGYCPTVCRLRYAGAPKAGMARLQKGDLGIEREMFP